MQAAIHPLLEAMAWFSVLKYAPTRHEFWLWVQGKRDENALNVCLQEGMIVERRGRLTLPHDAYLYESIDERERVFPRKWKKIRRLSALLAFIPSIRFFAIGNTTALGLARDEADIDVFIIVKRGSLWLTRLLIVGLARLFGRRPGSYFSERDAWCFSFFIDDSDLSLQRFAIGENDPYLAHWVIRLLPMLDDGIGQELWRSNEWAWRDRTVQAPWIAWKQLTPRATPWPKLLQKLDALCFKLQRRFGARELVKAAERLNTEVVLNSHVCKAHVDDRRAWYRAEYEALVAKLFS